MASRKSMAFVVGIALTVYGVILLLEQMRLVRIDQRWWFVAALMIVGVLAVIGRGTKTMVMGWICLIFGGVLLFMAMGIFTLPGLWNYAPAVSWIAFGVFLLG